MKIKEHILNYPALPKDMFRVFILSNFGRVVVASTGLIYMNQGKTYILAFDKLSQDKFLYDFNDAIVEYVEL